MSRLDDDLAAFLAATDGATRQAALADWLTDATQAITILAGRVSDLSASDQDDRQRIMQVLNRLELHALRSRLIWNPRRLHELSGDDPRD